MNGCRACISVTGCFGPSTSARGQRGPWPTATATPLHGVSRYGCLECQIRYGYLECQIRYGYPECQGMAAWSVKVWLPGVLKYGCLKCQLIWWWSVRLLLNITKFISVFRCGFEATRTSNFHFTIYPYILLTFLLEISGWIVGVLLGFLCNSSSASSTR